MLFGSSGIRARFDQELPRLSLAAGAAVGRNASSVVVGRDTRTTSPVLAQGITGGLLATGADVFDAGIAPTPTIAYSARYHDAGCMITASHNPEEYNGLKLFNPDGSSFGRRQQEEVEVGMDTPHWSSWDYQGTLAVTDALIPHRAAILDRVECTRSLRVVIDCGNGAGSVMTPRVLGELGVVVVPVHCTPDGTFPRPSEPLPEHLPYIGELVRQEKAQCALAHDGDADRMVAWDARGQWISGDQLMVLFASYLGAKRVVTTMDASMAIETIAEVMRTPVGDAFVSEQLRSWGDFGAEPSGTWIFPTLSLCPDGVYAAALFCEMATEWNIGEEIAKLPELPMLRVSIPTAHSHEILRELGATNPTDGVRFTKEHGWILIRASGTEPKVRITVEGDTREHAKQLMETGRALVQKAEN